MKDKYTILRGNPSWIAYLRDFAIQSFLLHLKCMNNEMSISFEEKMARLQGFVNQLQTEKLRLQAEIDILSKEKNIMMKALEQYAEMEETLQTLRERNVQLESQLNSLVSSLEKVEQGL